MVNEIDYKIIQQADLRIFAKHVFKRIGCNSEDAELASDVLLKADLRGIDSHGVARLSGYVRLFNKGRINTSPNIKIIRETFSTGTLDGDMGLGLVVAPKAMEIAIEKSGKVGSGWISVTNSNHFGIGAYHSMKAIEHDMIGYSMTNASPLVAPTFSKERMLGTNPICCAIPAGKEQPVVIDLATSAAANGKLEIAQRNNKSVPKGWIQTSDGKETTDSHGLKKGGALLPLGSNRELGSHKGFALSALVDILSGVLSGANYGPWVPPFVSFLDVLPNLPGKGLGHFLGAMQVDGFIDKEEFKKRMDHWINRFKEAIPIEHDQPVIIPGGPEFEHFTERSKNGIPIIDAVIEDLKSLALELNLEHPF